MNRIAWLNPVQDYDESKAAHDELLRTAQFQRELRFQNPCDFDSRPGNKR
jgi:hypothetical protein